MFPGRSIGLDVLVPTPAVAGASVREITDEAAIWAPPRADLRVEPLVERDALVAQGAPVLRLRRQPEVVLTAPMAGRVAVVDLGPGQRLHEMRFFHEAEAGRHRFEVGAAEGNGAALRSLLQGAGFWPLFRSRPFGRMPPSGEEPAAIFVMGLDTRPHAPDPMDAVGDRREDLDRGLAALGRLTAGPVFFCHAPGSEAPKGAESLTVAEPVHPWGLAGFQIHARFPAAVGRPVWDIHAEDVAGIGVLLATGEVPETRRVTVTGPALADARIVECQPGADLRGLTYAHVTPGPHRILSGSALDGRSAHWLGARDRQVTVLGAHHGPCAAPLVLCSP